MTRIVYLISSIKAVGPLFSLKNLIENLPKNKYQIFLITLSNNQDNDLEEYFKKLGVIIHSLNLGKLHSLFLGRAKVEKEIQRISPDIIHSQDLRSDFINSRIKFRAKKLTTLRCFPYEDFINKHGKVVGGIAVQFFMFNMKRISYRVACSVSLAERIRQKTSIPFTPVINGLSDKKFHRKNKSLSAKRRSELGLPFNKKIFISVGDISKGKNPELIVNAFRRMEADHLLIFLGKGESLYNLKKTTKNFSNIIFKGKVKNVEEFLQASDFYVSASLSEGLPNAVMEAMGAGLPVALSNIPSHNEILEKGPCAGFLFENNNVHALENALMQLLNLENYNIASDCAYNLIKNHFSAQKMGASYHTLYEEINILS